MLDDPAATLVRCHDMAFLAVIHVVGVEVKGIGVPQLSLTQLDGNGVKIRY